MADYFNSLLGKKGQVSRANRYAYAQLSGGPEGDQKEECSEEETGRAAPVGEPRRSERQQGNHAEDKAG